jgi:hypothetical protein
MRFFLFSLFVFTFLSSLLPPVCSAENERQSYALDKLVNAQAQLERLEAQKAALDKLIRAVKEDLKAAKIRARAEAIQLQADAKRKDAAVLVEQSGVAVDLPDLMNSKEVNADIAQAKVEEVDKENLDLIFNDKQATESVFFPASSEKGLKADEIPEYVK